MLKISFCIPGVVEKTPRVLSASSAVYVERDRFCCMSRTGLILLYVQNGTDFVVCPGTKNIVCSCPLSQHKLGDTMGKNILTADKQEEFVFGYRYSSESSSLVSLIRTVVSSQSRNSMLVSVRITRL